MKKKLTSIICLMLAMVLTFTACGTPGNQGNTGNNGDTSLNGTYNITVWVSESAGVKELTEQQIAKFCEENPGIVINATVEGISEADSATQMIASVEDGADIYCFAQDQLARLVAAGALNELGAQAGATVKELNEEDAVKAASIGGKLYCYPITADNGYCMFYDKRVVAEEHIDSLEDIIADCEKAGKMFSFELETSAWYNAAFFFATGCVSEWTTDTEAQFVSVNDTFNSDAGLIALKGMQKLLKSTAYNSSSAASDFVAAVPSAVVVTGTWGSAAAKEALGENLGVADLPSFTVDGKSYHIGSYYGCKLMGVKPSTDAVKNAVLNKLALYLSGEKCQLDRYELVGWGPSNKNAQATDAVKNDPILKAIAAQKEYATLQGAIHGSWWDLAKAYAVTAKTATTDDELKAALKSYKDSIDGLFSMSDEVKRAWTVIGTVKGTNWDMDFTMTETSTGVWVSDEAFELTAGTEFKCRQGLSWDVSWGKDGNNYIVETAGTYKIQLTVTETSGTIELLPQ